MAAILSAWPLVENWEVVDGSPESIDKALQAVSSLLLNKVSWATAGTVAWILLSALKMNTDSTLQDAALVPNVQRYLGKLEEEPSISDSEALSDGMMNILDCRSPLVNEAHCTVEIEAWAADGWGGGRKHPQGAPNLTEFTVYWLTIYSGGVG